MKKWSYAITLVELDGTRVVDLGIFSAASPEHAIEQAKQRWRGTLGRIETGLGDVSEYGQVTAKGKWQFRYMATDRPASRRTRKPRITSQQLFPV